MPVYSYDPPEQVYGRRRRAARGAVFYLQASGGGRTTSVALEKCQVSQLAERLDELLDEVLQAHRRVAPRCPPRRPPRCSDDGPLDLPLMEEFRVGAIALAWDHDGEQVIIEAQEETDEPVEPLTEDVPADGPAVLRVRITPGAARAFSRRALQVVARGAAAVPAVRAAAGHRRARLPAAERAPGRACLTRTVPAAADRATASEAAARPAHRGTLEIEGRLVDASNATMYCTIRTGRRRSNGPRSGRGQTRRPRRRASTSRSRGSGRCGTSRRARWPAGRWPRTRCPAPAAGTSSRPRSSGTGRWAPACASCGSTTTAAWT